MYYSLQDNIKGVIANGPYDACLPKAPFAIGLPTPTRIRGFVGWLGFLSCAEVKRRR